MAVYSKATKTATGAAKAATAGTFDEVGSGITLRDDAKWLLGFLALDAHSTGIAAEALATRYRVSSQDIPTMGREEFDGPSAIGGRPATNLEPALVLPRWVPMLHKLNGNEKITVEITSLAPDPTTGFHSIVSAVYEAGDDIMSHENRLDFIRNYQLPSPVVSGRINAHDSAITGTTKTQLQEGTGGSSGMPIPSHAGHLLELNIKATYDAQEVDEGIFLTTLESDIPDFSPQEYPGVGFHAPLGTPPIGVNMPEPVRYSLLFPTPASKQYVVPYVTFTEALATASPTVSAELGYTYQGVLKELGGK